MNKEIKSFPDCIKKINELWFDEEEEDLDLIPNNSSVKMALIILTKMYFEKGEIPYFISPTVSNGLNIEYGNSTNYRTNYRCENGKLLILIWKYGTIEKQFEHQESDVSCWLV